MMVLEPFAVCFSLFFFCIRGGYVVYERARVQAHRKRAILINCSKSRLDGRLYLYLEVCVCVCVWMYGAPEKEREKEEVIQFSVFTP